MILPLSLLMGLVLGVSAHRAGLCTVKAVAEVMTSRRGWFLWSFLRRTTNLKALSPRISTDDPASNAVVVTSLPSLTL